ncbi:MAG: hypothetical protein EZS28_017830 [Streblomastix strix]|uniref:Uncharacterized protein n=1 Tax=Streblomastix strix TaxID=222440 RepID=A0A5J4VWV5_9EUKA|nr:MAG: hypothetical protein EZS28_017830 [Streblomastix strix]
MNAARISMKGTITSFRKAFITKGIDYWTTEQDIDRLPMHANGSGIVQGYYNRNINDKICERLSNFEQL